MHSMQPSPVRRCVPRAKSPNHFEYLPSYEAASWVAVPLGPWCCFLPLHGWSPVSMHLTQSPEVFGQSVAPVPSPPMASLSLHPHVHVNCSPAWAQVSVDIPWSPYGIDGRNYDWAGLAEAADLLFVMAYDMQSQVGPHET